MTDLKVVLADATPETEGGDEKRARGSQVNRILEGRLKIYRGTDGHGWGDILDRDGNIRTIPTASNEYKMWLAGRYLEKYGAMPGAKPLKAAHDMVDHLARRARYDYNPRPDFDDSDVEGEDDETQGKAAALIKELMKRGVGLFHTDDDDDSLRAYADITEGGLRKTLPVKGSAFERWVRYIHYQSTKNAVPQEVLKMAIATLAAKADFEGPERNVSLRIATDPDTKYIYLDLGGDCWKAVEIRPNGWDIVDSPPVRFRRSQAMHALPEPARGGSFKDLRGFLNIKDDADFLLICGALCCYLRPGFPFPILVFQGEAGAAKSTACKVLRRLIDPNKADLRDPPHKIDDLLVTTIHNHVITVENASSISPSLSDALCRLATGAGSAKRGLYTNHDEVVIDARRPVIMNGIEFPMRDDLASRAVFIELTPIPDTEMRDEDAFWASYTDAQPRILGAICDAISTGLANIDEVKPRRLPRMADFMKWGIACSRDFAVNEGDFEKAYWRNVENLTENVIEGDPVSVAVREFAYRLHKDEPSDTRETPYTDPETRKFAEPRRFKGTSSELLKRLEHIVDDKTKSAKGWPSNGSVLSRRITRAAPTLRKAGIDARKPKRQGSTRFIEIYAAKRPKEDDERAATADPYEVDPEDFRD